MMIYGYIRVSTKEQNEDRQRIAMQEWGIARKQIFMDKQSGKDFDRPQYRRLYRRLKKGDTLVVKSIDRLGRNYDEILEQWRFITKEKHADIVVLDMPLLDTRTYRDLTGTLIADIVLQLLSYVAHTERDLIRQRQAEGIAAAKARGVVFGRPPMPVSEEFDEVYDLWKDRFLSLRAASKRLGVSHQTFERWAREREAQIKEDSAAQANRACPACSFCAGCTRGGDFSYCLPMHLLCPRLYCRNRRYRTRHDGRADFRPAQLSVWRTQPAPASGYPK